MNLNDYETKYFPIYEAFAETIRFILKKALIATANLPRPQSIQCRAKGIDSLRRRLKEASKLDSQTLELDRRDLAGARLIFYTNNDVDRFVASPLIRENFEIEEDSTRIHQPTPENEESRYRAIHYTVRLHEDRLRLPEYAKFMGLRCEIQVQTILNHAWSETSHDIIYKNKLGEGYGGTAMKGIARRFEQIMDEYLIPAGFEIQKAQQDYERVAHGKELFDKDISNLLDNAQNNNERYEILSGLRDYAIPNYDDLPTAYDGLKGPLLRAVRAAREAEPVPIETTYGNMEGFKTDAVTRLVVEIIKGLRYVDRVGTLKLLIDIYRDETNDVIRQEIVNAVQKMSEYNIDAYNQVGPMVQMELVEYLAGLGSAEVDSIRPIAITVWTEAIQSDITGAKWKADSVVLSTGAVPASSQLREVRDKAIESLFSAYGRSTDDAEKRAVFSALDVATNTPHQAKFSNELLAFTIKDATRIVEFATERSAKMSYELLQYLEHKFLFYYRRAIDLTDDAENRFGCQTEAKDLAAAVLRFRDKINTNELFVRYKVLVGFESVYPSHWVNEEFDYKGVEKYRQREIDRYIDEINASNENDWFKFTARCAETKSNDLATFPVFANFISKLAERKPEVADRFLAKTLGDLRHFIASFLNGLALSGRRDIYEQNLDRELESARNLVGVIRHLRYSNVSNPNFDARLMMRAIENDDPIAVSEFFLFVLEHYGTEKIADGDTLARDALAYLNERKDPRWVMEGWFARNAAKFYEELTPERTTQVLENLGYLRKVDYRAERALVEIAKRQPEAVWDYFGARLAREATAGEYEERFEAAPFEFHGLEKELSKDPQLAIKKGMSWFADMPDMFRFRGGLLISRVFPDCTPEFADALTELVKAGGDTEADFALEILQNFEGEASTHVVLKEIVSRYPEDNLKMSEVGISIDNTGMVSGELGFAEAWRARKAFLAEWLADERPAVKAFAERHIAELNQRIASEHRRAESEKEMRQRSYQEDDNEPDGDKRPNG